MNTLITRKRSLLAAALMATVSTMVVVPHAAAQDSFTCTATLKSGSVITQTYTDGNAITRGDALDRFIAFLKSTGQQPERDFTSVDCR